MSENKLLMRWETGFTGPIICTSLQLILKFASTNSVVWYSWIFAYHFDPVWLCNVESFYSFIQYLGQRKKLEAEERRMKQKRAREEFTKMLEVCCEKNMWLICALFVNFSLRILSLQECKELTSSMRWRYFSACFGY